jgi:hypothetical protein
MKVDLDLIEVGVRERPVVVSQDRLIRGRFITISHSVLSTCSKEPDAFTFPVGDTFFAHLVHDDFVFLTGNGRLLIVKPLLLETLLNKLSMVRLTYQTSIEIVKHVFPITHE